MRHTIVGYPYSTSYTASFSAAVDMLRITLPANPADAYEPRKYSLLLHRVHVITTTSETDENARISLHRGTTAGTGGSALSFTSLDGSPAFTTHFGGSGVGGMGDVTKDETYIDQGAELSLGWEWNRWEHPVVKMAPGYHFIVRLASALSGTTSLTINVEFDMAP